MHRTGRRFKVNLLPNEAMLASRQTRNGGIDSKIKEVLKLVDVTQSVRLRYYKHGKSDRTKV